MAKEKRISRSPSDKAGPTGVAALRCASRDGALVCMLGWAVLRIWSQGTLYDAYRASDAGLISLAGSLAYSVVYLVVAFVSLRRPPGSRAMGWTCFACMVAAPVASMVSSATGTAAAFVAHALLAGLGTAVGSVMWVLPYSRLRADEVVFWVFACMAATALGGYTLSFVDHPQSDLLCVLLAPVVLLAYLRALAMTADAGYGGRIAPEEVSSVSAEKITHVATRTNTSRGILEPSVAMGITRPVRADCERAMGVGASPAEPLRATSSSPSRSALLPLLVGIATFGLMLGISRGYPSGSPIALDVLLRTVYQLGVVAVSAFIVWWALVHGGRLSHGLLWRIELAVASVAVLVLLLVPGATGSYAVALMNVANSLMIGIIMLDVIDVSRVTGLHPYVVQSVAGCTRGLSRDAGRLLVMAIAATSQPLTVGMVAIVLALAVSAALLLSDGMGSGAAEGGRAASEDGPDGPGGRARVERTAAPAGGTGDGSCSGPHAATVRGTDGACSGRRAVTGDDAGVGARGAWRGATEGSPVMPSIAEKTDPVSVGLDFERADLPRPVIASDAAEAALRDRAAQIGEHYRLTERETQVALLIARGHSKTRIADLLGLKESTVRTHAKSVYAKLGVQSREELMELFG